MPLPSLHGFWDDLAETLSDFTFHKVDVIRFPNTRDASGAPAIGTTECEQYYVYKKLPAQVAEMSAEEMEYWARQNQVASHNVQLLRTAENVTYDIQQDDVLVCNGRVLIVTGFVNHLMENVVLSLNAKEREKNALSS